MINKLIDVALYILDWIYNIPTITNYFNFWNELTGYIASYQYTLTNILEGIYFFVGKTLVVFVWDFSIACFGIACILAVIYLIGQFVP